MKHGNRNFVACKYLAAVFACGFLLPALASAQSYQMALLLQQTPAESGLLAPEPGLHFFEPESQIVLTAIPKPGFRFVCWLGDVADPTASTTVAYIDKPKIVIALFQPESFPLSAAATYTTGRLLLRPLTFPTRPFVGVSLPTPAPSITRLEFEPLEPIPEPATLLLLAVGAVMLRKRKTPH